MAWQHIHLVRQLELPYVEKLILFALASRVDDRSECWPSVATLRKDTGLAHRTVQYHLRALVDRGLVFREERRGATALLRLHLSVPCISAPRSQVQSDDDKGRRVRPPVHDVHATGAQAAPEVNKELPINRQEEPAARKLILKPVVQNRNSGTTKENQAWWATRAGIDAKGRELQVPARLGEGYAEYKGRLLVAERRHRGAA